MAIEFPPFNYNKTTRRFSGSPMDNLDIFTSLAATLNVTRGVAQVLFFKVVYNAGPKLIGKALVGGGDVLDNTDATTDIEIPTDYEAALKNLGEVATAIINDHIVEAYKLLIKNNAEKNW
jgi:hypothetical protein